MKTPKKKRKWSLAAQLAFLYSLSSFFIISFATICLFVILSNELSEDANLEIQEDLQRIQYLLQDYPQSKFELNEQINMDASPQSIDKIYYRILEPISQSIIMETTGMDEEIPLKLTNLKIFSDKNIEWQNNLKSISGSPIRLLTFYPPKKHHGEKNAIIQIAMDLSHHKLLLKHYGKMSIFVISLSCIFCAIAGFVIAKKGLKSFQDIDRAIKQIQSSTLNSQIDIDNLPLELSELGQTFNEMLIRLEDSFNRIAQFSDDIAHEIRTPLNNLKGEMELALNKNRSPEEYCKVLESCLEECDYLSQLAEKLLFLARSDHPETKIFREQLWINNEIQVIRDFYEPMAVEKSIQLKVNIESNLSAELDKTMFRRAISNLLDNAIFYTPRGGNVEIIGFKSKNLLTLQVIDSGCGIPSEALPRIFDRFFRIDKVRSSSRGHMGLGLSLVKTIVTLHGGDIRVNSKETQGTQFSLSFPQTHEELNVHAI